MFDLNKLKDRAAELGAVVSQQVAKNVPIQFSDEKKFSRGYAAVLALLVVADREVETDETVQVLNFIQSAPNLREMNLVPETLGFYADFVAELEPTFQNEPTFLVKCATIIEESVAVVTDPVLREELAAMVRVVAGAAAAPPEADMRNRIVNALS